MVRPRKIDGKPQWEYVSLKGTSPAPDPARLAVVDGWRTKHESFLVNPARGQDGYTMLPEKMLKKMPEVDLKQQAIERRRSTGAQGVAPTVDGKFCDATRPGPSLAVGP